MISMMIHGSFQRRQNYGCDYEGFYTTRISEQPSSSEALSDVREQIVFDLVQVFPGFSGDMLDIEVEEWEALDKNPESLEAYRGFTFY